MQANKTKLYRARGRRLPGLLLFALILLYPHDVRALDFTGLPWVQYGDAQSYSLPVSQSIDGCTGPGCSYYVGSSPGLIQDLIVVATGTNSNPVTTNFTGMDNAFPTPSGSGGATFFSTGTTTDPTPNGFTGDQPNTWDTTLLALKTFLNGQTLVFFFNNNQTNSGSAVDQNLAAWGQVSVTNSGGIVNSGGNLVGIYDFTNNNNPYAGVLPSDSRIDGNVGSYTSTGAGPGATATGTDYVLSGGQLCLNAGVLVSCSSPHDTVLNHNLGANEAAYALIFPELNAQLTSLFSLSDAQLAAYSLHIDLRLGCDSGLFSGAACIGKDLNNGYEQLFIARLETVVTGVPEPSSFILFGIGLLGLAALKKRRSA